MITVILLNWKRQKNILDKIIPSLSKNSLVNEIIISHGNKSTYFSTPNSKNIKHYYDAELNKKLGVSLRFYRASFAKNDCVLFIDDDKLPSNKYIQKLYNEFQKDPYNIIGSTKRYVSYSFGYMNRKILPTDKKIILTQILMSNKNICKYFLENKDFMNSFALSAKPVWNGEDILFNILFINKYKKIPKQILKQKDDITKLNEEFAIHKINGHMKYRKKFSRFALKHLKMINREKIFLLIVTIISIILIYTKIYPISNLK